MFERLEGVGEIWGACFRKPKPGWRLFGRFVAKDTLVLSVGFDRLTLASASNYQSLAVASAQDLNARFPALPTHSGGAAADYIGGLIYDMDEA